ncbi:putative membrane protein [Clostridium sp. N3C]|nr:putative membrane protein [Clostridium sp. N3C]
MEVIWTGLGALLNGDIKLSGTTYIWMFPIYGSAVFLEPIQTKLRNMPFILRGGVYGILILLTEYVSGIFLRYLIGCCPWDYSGNPLSLNGVIRLDYFPVWCCVGLLFEKIHSTLDRVYITT